jgi:hypothetical protein
MSEQKIYGDFEQVNGAVLNAANKRIAELEAKLEAIEKQEPVAGWYCYDPIWGKLLRTDPRVSMEAFRVYALPPLRELSDEEIYKELDNYYYPSPDAGRRFARAILAKAREV